MYGHIALDKKDYAPHRTIYADDDALAQKGWDALAGELKDALVRLAESERAGARVATSSKSPS
jgi:hypothetical protein